MGHSGKFRWSLSKLISVVYLNTNTVCGLEFNLNSSGVVSKLSAVVCLSSRIFEPAGEAEIGDAIGGSVGVWVARGSGRARLGRRRSSVPLWWLACARGCFDHTCFIVLE